MGNQVVTQQQSNIDEFLKFTKDQVDLSQEFEILTPRRRRTYFTSFITGWEFFESSKEFHVENKGINLQELFTFSDNAVYVVLHTFIKRKRRHDQPKDNQEKKEKKQIPKIIENLKENITQRSQTRSFSGYHSTYSQLQNENNGKPKHLMGNTPKMKYDIYVWHGKKVTQITKAVSMSKVLELENFISTDNIQQYLLSLFFNKTFYTTNVGLVLGGHIPSHNIEKSFKKLISFNHLISYLNKRSIPKKKENLSQFSCSESNLISTPTQNKRIQNFINQRNKQLLTQPQLQTPKSDSKDVKNEAIEIKKVSSDEQEVSNDKKPKTNNKICNKHTSILDSRESIERIPRVSKSIIHNFEIQLSPRRSKSTLHDGNNTSQYNIQIKSETIDEDEDTNQGERQDSEIEGIQVTENDSGPISNLKINITHINSNNDNSNPQNKMMIPKLQLNISNIDPNNNNNNNTTDNAIIPLQTPSKMSVPKLQLNISSPNENTDINIPTSPKKKEKSSKSNPPKSPDNKKRRKKKRPDAKKLKTHRENSSLKKNNSNATAISTSRHHKMSGKKNSLSFGVSLDINLVKRELAKGNSNTNNPHNNNNNLGFGLNITKTSSPPTSPTANYLPFNLPERIRYYDAICSQITDQIFLGSNTIAKDQEKLQSNGITHVLNCAASVCDNYFPNTFHYKSFKLADTPNEDITTLFYEVLDYIDNVVSNNGKVFVHCYQGISRSASMVILYLMWKNKSKFSETHEYVKRIREIANPNAGFICQLMLFFQRKKVSPIIPCLYQVRPHKTANDAIGLRYCDTSEGLDDTYCYLVQNSQNHLYLWKGNNIHPDYLEYTFIYAQRLQKFEGFQSELFIEESGQESSEFKSLLQFRSESLKSRKP